MTQDRDLDPFTAEQLLSGGPVDGEVGPLADLLAAAAAPARADELTGEAAAVAVFRDAAGASRPATVTAVTSVRSGVSKTLGLKVAIAIAAVAGAGVAGAAAAGVLPGGDSPAPVAAPPSVTQSPSARTTIGSSTPPDDPADGGQTRGPSTRTPSSPHSAKPSVPRRPTVKPSAPATPSEEIITMCRVYVAFAAAGKYDERWGDNDHGDRYWYPSSPNDRPADILLDQPSFQPLVRAAGGKPKVPSYCKRVLKNSPLGSRAPEGATPSTRPSVHPSGQPTTDPTSRLAASQTGTASRALPPPRGR